MADNGNARESAPSTAELHIASFQATTRRAIEKWSDPQLDEVIAKLRREGTSKPERFALLMFLEDARLQRHQLRAGQHSDGNGARPDG